MSRRPTVSCSFTSRAVAWSAVCLLLVPLSPGVTWAQPGAATLSGVVLDASGAPVAAALVRVEVSGGESAEARTAPDGRFTISGLAAGEALIRAVAPGFAEARVRVVTTAAGAQPVSIVLQPAGISEIVTVTASRGVERLATPAAASVLTSAEILNSAAGTVDDALRNTPGFSLFRRSSSRVANPSAQGVTLRGLAGSGASRTLVLADGLPLNDAFGSWVYWNRVPQAAIDRVEVVRGAAGDLYGPDALGGVIQVLTLGLGRPRLRASVEGGSHETVRVSAFGGGVVRGWIATAAGEWLQTDGVRVVAREQRGPVDVPASSDYRTSLATVGYTAGPWRAQARASVYGEDRGNGTPAVTNDTDWRQLSAEAGGLWAGGVWLVRGAGGTQDYFNNFSAVSAGRASERRTNEQRIPSRFAHLAGQWARPVGRHVFVVGTDGKRTTATVHETRYSPAGAVSGPFLFGGTELIGSIFGRASLAASERITIGLGARGDFWTSNPREAAAPSHSINFFSPRASLSWQLQPAISVQVSAYRAYRTPTLNELHRGFRVGNVVTDGNPLLEPERLTGVEGGVLLARRRFSARATGFWNHLDEAITNVTLRVTPAQITRQKQNADRVRAAGLELEADFRPHPALSVTALAAITASHFRGSPALPELKGNRVPQVAAYQLGAGVTYADPRLTISAQFRAVGPQFDDDRNQFELGAFAVLDAYASRSITRRLQVFVGVENLFDAEYDVGRTPVRTVGWPRTVRGGVRVFVP